MKTHPCLHLQPSFTLIELMAATTVLSVVLLMMVGMQDQMSKAWSNANRRTDANREARAALSLMTRDLSRFYYRPSVSSGGRFDTVASAVTNAPFPFYYFDGTGAPSLTIPNYVPGTAMLFGLVPQKGQTNPVSDFALVGYYVGSTNSTNVNGFVANSYNLFRYYIPPSNAWSNVSQWLASPNGSAPNLFKNINSNSEILARNACNLRMYFPCEGNAQVTNGFNFSVPASPSSSKVYTGNKLAVEISLYPEDYAQKIATNQWTNTLNIQKYARSYEFRVDMEKP
ncbi:MAG: hypothetical protein EBZ78_09600 [Verrucomicrobia bacterium]|nr:hypothetical protein [Verrucomicrobiota bacterium]